MTALESPKRRGEERFTIEEPVSVFDRDGAELGGRTKDISLAGAGIAVDPNDMFRLPIGAPISVFITGVGLIAATIVHRDGQFVGVRFDLQPSVERDLLIRKLFTSRVLVTPRTFSARSATWAMLRSIWAMRTRVPGAMPPASGGEATQAPEKLPAMSLTISPRPQAVDLDTLAKRRLVPNLERLSVESTT